MVAPIFNMTVLPPGPHTFVSPAGALTSVAMANLLSPQPGEKVALPAGASFLVLHPQGSVNSQLALLYTNFTSADTVRVRASTDITFATNVTYDSGAIAPWAAAEQAGRKARPDGYRHFFHQPNAASNGFAAPSQYTRLDFNLAGARTAGRLIAGVPIQPEYNPDYSETVWGYEEADPPDLLDSGVEVLYESTPAPFLKFRLSWLTEVEMNADWEPLARLQHTGEPVLVTRRPDAHNDRHNGLFYGRLRMTPIVAQDFDMFEVQGQIRSMV